MTNKEKGARGTALARLLPLVGQIHAFSCMQVKTESSRTFLTSVIKPGTGCCKLISDLCTEIQVFFVQFDRGEWYNNNNNNNNYSSPK